MKSSKLAEFATVLIFALVLGAGVWLIIRYVENNISRLIAFIVLAVAAVLALSYLRKRFGRG